MESSIWAIVIAVLLILEFVTMGLISIWFALGSLAGFVMSFFNLGELSILWEILASLILSLILIAATRKFVKRFLGLKAVGTNADGMIGQETFLLDDIGENRKGTVRLNGCTWTAACNSPIASGEKVKVIKIDGNKLWVEKAGDEKISIDKKDSSVKTPIDTNVERAEKQAKAAETELREKEQKKNNEKTNIEVKNTKTKKKK